MYAFLRLLGMSVSKFRFKAIPFSTVIGLGTVQDFLILTKTFYTIGNLSFCVGHKTNNLTGQAILNYLIK